MPTFTGFSSSKTHSTPLPAGFFSELLTQIDTLAELKVTLYTFWFLNQQEDPNRFITTEDFSTDAQFLNGLDAEADKAKILLVEGLEKAVQRGTLLKTVLIGENIEQVLYFLNSPKGRASLSALQSGDWQPDLTRHHQTGLRYERPNIFSLYENNIGPLTPLIADTLREAEQTYSADWIYEAMKIAVEGNVRNWRYVEAILRSWKEKGRYGTDRRNTPEDRRRYVEGEFSNFIEH